MRRDQNDLAKTNSQNPEPEGSGKKHHPTEPQALLLCLFFKKINL